MVRAEDNLKPRENLATVQPFLSNSDRRWMQQEVYRSLAKQQNQD